MTSDQKDRLDKLGFDWGTQDHVTVKESKKAEHWDTRYQQLKEYYEAHQTCEVPPTFEDSKLYQWVCSQKKAAKSGNMREDRFKKLASINFWDTFPVEKQPKTASLGRPHSGIYASEDELTTFSLEPEDFEQEYKLVFVNS